MALKDAYRVHNPQLAQADVVVLPDSCDPACPPGSYYLSTSITGTIVEPEGTGHDDHGTSYNDPNYWDFCTAGAATATLYYWKPSNVTTTNWWATGRFHEPALNNTGHSATTYWAVTDSQYGMTVHGRSYLMYLAEYVKPPSYAYPGEVNFSKSSGPYGTLLDLRDALNWEASGHNASTWQNYFYQDVYRTSLTQSSLHIKIAVDIGLDHVSPVVFAMTDYLPNWNHSGILHAITITGYNDYGSTYTYVDTCSQNCRYGYGTTGGTFTISQTALWNAVNNGPNTAGIDW